MKHELEKSVITDVYFFFVANNWSETGTVTRKKLNNRNSSDVGSLVCNNLRYLIYKPNDDTLEVTLYRCDKNQKGEIETGDYPDYGSQCW